jgi:hypothetical protein
MSKTIKSPSKQWPGEVVLSDPLTFPQILAFEDAIGNVKAAGNKVTQARADSLTIPGIIPCVEVWRLEGFPTEVTEATFPASPRIPCTQLITWLVKELTVLFTDGNAIPNA